MQAQDPDNYDLTGTIIHSNNPVGVTGGSMDANIPADFPYANFVCEMIPPVRTWGETYYATNYIQASGQEQKDFARYLFISSVPGQTIFRQDITTGVHVECTIPNQNDIYWDELELGEKIWSNAPFLCASYINSNTYPDGNNGEGSPAEGTINPREQYRKTVVFQAAKADSAINQDLYDNYAEIICNVKAVDSTTFDSIGLRGFTPQAIDDTFEIFTIPHIAPGVHTVKSDSGVGVYVYGYGFDESYAWSSPAGVGTFQSPDSTAPTVEMTALQCSQEFIHVSDSGLLPNSNVKQSGLAEMRVDSIDNMIFDPNVDWIEGSGADTSGYTASVANPSLQGILIVQVCDVAANSTTITTVYDPLIEIKPPLANLGLWRVGEPPNIAYDTLYNLGTDTISLEGISLQHGDLGFSIDTTGDLSPIPPGGFRTIKIEFQSVKSTPVVDSIMISNACAGFTAALLGGAANDFTVSNQTWANEPLPAPLGGYLKSVTISNLSNIAISIDSSWWADTTHFVAVSKFPAPVPAYPGTALFTIAYIPDSNSAIAHNSTIGSWFSPQVLESGVELARNDTLIGWALSQASVNETNSSTTEATILPMSDGRSLEIILPNDMNGTMNFQLVNVLGESVLRSTFSVGTQTVDASALPRGVYFYRLTSGQMNQCGKVIFGGIMI